MGNARIQIRRGSAAFWDSENPVLHPGEPGYETDTKKLKIGDGVSHWRELAYFAGGIDDIPVDQASLLAHINSSAPHPIYDDGPSLFLLYQNAKV
jgi:hypothetical protein